MRPPDLPGGNAPPARAVQCRTGAGFNEAAGFTRRKHDTNLDAMVAKLRASMRPPDLPGGNGMMENRADAFRDWLQ